MTSVEIQIDHDFFVSNPECPSALINHNVSLTLIKYLPFIFYFISLIGASKEIGTALTRVCLRHKAVETRLKTFTTAIMDSLIIPLQVEYRIK